MPSFISFQIRKIKVEVWGKHSSILAGSFLPSLLWRPSQSILTDNWTRNSAPGNHQPAFPPINQMIHFHIFSSPFPPYFPFPPFPCWLSFASPIPLLSSSVYLFMLKISAPGYICCSYCLSWPLVPLCQIVLSCYLTSLEGP